MRILLFYLLFFTSLYSLDFKVATYNVENLFDLKKDGSEYNEYIPNKSSKWNKKNQTIKLNHIAKVLKELNAHIVGLQEIESKEALNSLLEYLPEYKYSSFLKNQKSAVGVAVISKFPIIKTTKIDIDSTNPYTRPILETTLKITSPDTKQTSLITIFTNHWRSKKAAENERVSYALALQNRIKKIQKDIDYILLGDFNSNYNEYKSFKNDKKLNNTYGITGINQILNTTVDNRFVTQNKILLFDNKKVHYNLWLEINKNNRFSYKFRGENSTPDNIIIPPSLFDNKNISYIDNSFNVFKPIYLYKNGKINRWKTIGKNRRHKGQGYSDHLPIYATFSTKSNLNRYSFKIKTNDPTPIERLYHIETLDNPIKLNSAVVIYKHKNNAIIKEPNGRSIYVYNCAKYLNLGGIYDLEISKLNSHYGLKEISEISKLTLKKYYKNYEKMYQDANNINIFDSKYQNEIVTNLKATFKKGYLYFNNKKIKLYAKDKSILPKNGQKVSIISGHLAVYRSKPQIIIYSKSDFNVD